ncbi:ARM repeat superfamily protein, putative isoform 1 [Hibiscus syriacus]|uniref:ARM repeat superfamily protein, putative isoform 1 n=1 Tax=Hibiscus syriacus TaxID=106335 RepID=A0A6A2YDB1_HIBSY|nr:ARM repeat superfamily protein, putative isoform 1 [Hibiscus syriacus]
MGEFGSYFSCSSLLCHETQEADCCFETEPEDEDESLFFNDKDDEYIESLIQREISTTTSSSDYRITDQNNWLRCARLNAIEWIFNTRTLFGFQIHTAYLSVVYFDRFLSKKSIDHGKLWAIQLLSLACLSIAAKMEECRVPVLSEFPTQDYKFQSKTIQRMELLVLTTFEWKMTCVTPFSYLSFFIHKFYGECIPKGLVSKALQHILVLVKEINSVEHRSSVIAAAAVLASSCDQILTRKTMELKMDFISLWGSLETEHLFFCYNMMHEIEMGKSKTPKSVISSNYSSLYRATENSSAVRIGTKRELTFKESDQ